MEHPEGMDADGAQDLSIPADIAHFYRLGVLGVLLADRTTGSNIIWATNAYEGLGEEFAASNNIGMACIIGGAYSTQLRRRAQKERDEQVALTRNHAEVFTPMWVCKLMIDHADAAWMESRGIESLDDAWREYVKSNRLEITCGEAPYLVSRYDAESGQTVPLDERTGILDRKLHLVTSHVQRRQDWILWATKAVQSTYGYEFQGDNLLIARINILRSVEDHLAAAGYSSLQDKEYKKFAEIISWNLWQMDGLIHTVPFGHISADYIQDDLFGDLVGDSVKQEGSSVASAIRNWKSKETIDYRRIRREINNMKFDYIIGNPPYQEESHGANENDLPLYHYFYDNSVEISKIVELIMPARFLFNAGGTPSDWNKRMVNDIHNEVVLYEADSSKIFPNTSISGGITIIFHDEEKVIGPIGTFTPFPELTSIVNKVDERSNRYLFDLVTNRGLYRYSGLAYSEQPEEMKKTADRRIAPSAFTRMASLFTEEEPQDGDEYVQIYGVINGRRGLRWFKRKYVKPVENLDSWKVVISKADGAAGQVGKPIPARICGRPTVLGPGIGFAETFISIGSVETRQEAENIAQYIRTKFARVLLGVLKVTQNNAKPTWKKIPMQDFSTTSDIDWSQSISDIDAQLYRKYGLSQEEIDFIESHVEEMD